MYNVKPYLEDCLQSIVNQNLGNSNITYEIYCIDDGSKDGSYEFLLDRMREIPQLRVEKNEGNKGVSYTRNRLMREAKGKYIWFVDPDDMLINKVVDKFYQYAEQYKVDIILGDYIRVEELTKTNEGYEVNWSNIHPHPSKKNDYLPQDSTGKRMCALWAGLFLKDFLISNMLLMNEKMIAQEDTLFYYEFSLKTDNIWKLDSPCYLYRQRKGSAMNSYSDERAKKYYIAMREMLRVYEEHLTVGDYKNLEELQRKIHHSKQNVATCLAAILDKQYIKKELKILKKEGIYPYKFRKAALKSKEPLVIRWLNYLMPLELFFWIYHLVYKIKHNH